MLIDFRSGGNEHPESAETLIVGSGAVGLTLAVELARAGRQVIMLEAGGRGVDVESQRYFTSARWRHQRLPGLHLGRFRMLGGTTNFWGGQLVEFDPIVFEHRPWVSDIAWPLTRQELDPYYERGYELLGMGHHLSDEKIWERLRVRRPELGDALEFYFSAWAPEPNFAALFGDEVRSSARLCAFVNAPVVSLELAERGDRVASVMVRTAAGDLRRFSGQRVILANGTVEIARLLKLPLADGRAAPWTGNPWLGKGFTDHIDCFGGHVTPLDKKRFHNLFDNAYLDRLKYAPKLKLSSRAQIERQLFGVTAFFLFNSSLQEHLGNAKLFVRSLFRGNVRTLPNPLHLLSSLRVAVPMIARYLRYRRIYNPVDQGIQLRLMGEQFPLTQSELHLGEKCDQLGMPLVDMDWRIDGREIESLATTAELVAEYLEKEQIASVRLDASLARRDPGLTKQFGDYYHQMGMARMASSPAGGVVDRDLKMFGTRNLYVAGAAVYPSTGFANPTFTAIALGLRLANAIRTERADC
jgi:hypothetical protein